MADGFRNSMHAKLADIFSYISKPSVAPPLAVAQTKLITHYGKTREVNRALELFDQMPQRTQVSWNAMLSTLVNSGRIDHALRMFDEMPHKNHTSYTSIISGLSRAGRVERARRVFDSLPPAYQNVYSWTAMISCHVQNHEPLEALSLFSRLYGDLYESGVIPNSHTLSMLLKACGLVQSIVATRQVHTLVVKLINEENGNCVYVQNALIDVYAKLGELADSEKVFGRMKFKDLSTWNTMMDTYSHHLMLDKVLEIFYSIEEKDVLSWNIVMSSLLDSHRGEEALRLFMHVLSFGEGPKPNPSTYTIVLVATATLTMLEFGKQVHARIIKIGFYLTNAFVSNSLITVYANCGLIRDMEQVFGEMPAKDIISWNSLIYGLGQNGCSRRAMGFAEEALSSKNYNSKTFISILTSCSHGGLIDEGLKFFNSMSPVYGINQTLDHYICIIDMLGRAGRVEEAYDILQKMPFEANSPAWGTLLNACVVHGHSELGRKAAEELLALDSSDFRARLVLQSIYNKIGGGNESGRYNAICMSFKKEPGCSWFVHTYSK